MLLTFPDGSSYRRISGVKFPLYILREFRRKPREVVGVSSGDLHRNSLSPTRFPVFVGFYGNLSRDGLSLDWAVHHTPATAATKARPFLSGETDGLACGKRPAADRVPPQTPGGGSFDRGNCFSSSRCGRPGAGTRSWRGPRCPSPCRRCPRRSYRLRSPRPTRR